MQRSRSAKIHLLMLFFILFNACSSPDTEKSKKFDLTVEEHLWMEKFLRYFMLHETAIYTLAGSKPLTKVPILCYDTPEEQLRDEKREQRVYFLLNRDNEKDMEFYEKLSPVEKEEKAYLIYDKDFIYSIEDLWNQWEKIQHRFPIKKRFLLVKKEWGDDWKEVFPRCKAAYEIFFVDVLRTAFVIQENYELFRQAVGYDFDSLQVVFELENKNSQFWDTLRGKDAWRYATLWGLLYGFGKENSFAHAWKWRHIRELHCCEKEKLLAEDTKQRSSCRNQPCIEDRGAFSISNFPIPIFASFTENDPVVIKYEMEKEKIKRLYQGKDFVNFTLELLTELPDTPEASKK